ncbi:MAG: 4Fe-4S dicluster domain-containing protein [Candidatus Syntropharchaeia archaeon]
MRSYIISDPERCSGCKVCELVCSAVHEGVFNLKKARINVDRSHPEFAFSAGCRFCAEPACIEKCPKDALTQDENGIIIVDEELCISCGLCVKACKFKAMKLHVDTKMPITCDLCNGDPECIKFCPEGALKLTSTEIIAQNARRSFVKEFIFSL